MLSSQQEWFSLYWPRLCTDVHGYVDWAWTLKQVEQFIAAFDAPYKGVVTFLNQEKVRLKKGYSIVSDGTFHPFQVGIIYKIRGDCVFVAMEQGSLVIQDIRDEDGDDIISNLKVGDRFFTPSRYLEKAKESRAVYTSQGLRQ